MLTFININVGGGHAGRHADVYQHKRRGGGGGGGAGLSLTGCL